MPLSDREVSGVSGGLGGHFWSESGMIYYRVAPRDTLSEIALQAKVPLSQILTLNPEIVNPDLIEIGWRIRIR